MAFGLIWTVAMLVAVLAFSKPRFLEGGPTDLDMLWMTLSWCGLLAVPLVAAIGRLARHRFFSQDDIDGGGMGADTRKARVLQALLQNTLEQVVLAFIVYLAWAAMMPLQWFTIIPLAATTFLLGRMLFFVGYQHGAAARSAGFALTFYPSVGMVLLMVTYPLWR